MSTTTGSSVDEIRADAATTRAELSDTVAGLADKADVRRRAAEAGESARRHAGAFGGTAAGVLAVAGAVFGLLAWRRNRRRPVNRATRAWRSATRRFR